MREECTVPHGSEGTQAACDGASVKIGGVTLHSPFVLGPMAGYTNLPFRLLCRRAGAGLVCTEMVSAKGLQHGNHKTPKLMEVSVHERPVSMQIFGAEPDVMARAAEAACAAGADIIDINMGCTVRKVRKSGAGVELMKNPALAVAVTAAVCRATDVPVTVKLRAGMTLGDEGYLDLCRRLEAVGTAALCLHGRTAAMGMRGTSRPEPIARLVETVQVPVIGSGDIHSPDDAVTLLRETGCAAAMFARGALGRPWIFLQANELRETGAVHTHPNPQWHVAVALCHAELLAEHIGERLAIHQMRGIMSFYSRGLPQASFLRQSCQEIKTLAQLHAVVRQYLQGIADPAQDGAISRPGDCMVPDYNLQ